MFKNKCRSVFKIVTKNGLTENAGHEIAGHENAGHVLVFAIHDKYRTKIYYIAVQCAFHLNFKSFVCNYGECINVVNLTAPAHHKYSSVL